MIQMTSSATQGSARPAGGAQKCPRRAAGAPLFGARGGMSGAARFEGETGGSQYSGQQTERGSDA